MTHSVADGEGAPNRLAFLRDHGHAASKWDVIDAVRRAGGATRGQVRDATGLSWGTVSATSAQLLNHRILIEGQRTRTARVGPDSRLLEVNPAVGVFVGVNIGVERIEARFLDFALRPMVVHVPPIATGRDLAEFRANLRAVLADVLRLTRANEIPLLGVGFAWPGAVDHDKGRFRFAPNLAFAIDELTVAELLSEEHQAALRRCAIVMDHDSECAALAELELGGMLRRPRSERHLAVVSLGAGVGVGLVLDGKVFRGARNSAGELGHFVTGGPDDTPPCGCGKVGCLEQQVSTPALLRAARRRGLAADTIQTVLAQKAGADVLAEAGASLGRALSYVVNLLNPEVVVVSGELVVAYDYLYPALRRSLYAHTWRYGVEHLAIEPSRLGVEGVALGAAISAQHRLAREGLLATCGSAFS